MRLCGVFVGLVGGMEGEGRVGEGGGKGRGKEAEGGRG